MTKNKIIIISLSAISILAILFIGQKYYKSYKGKEKLNNEIKKRLLKDRNDIGNREIEKSNPLLNILETDIVLGDISAPVTIIEYASLSCPHCAEFYENGFDILERKYIKSGKVKLIYRDFPLNKPAFAAAIITRCYNNINKNTESYYKFIKTLFRSQDKWAFFPSFIHKLEEIALLEIGMSKKEFKSCIDNENIQAEILRGRLKSVKSFNIKSTPTFIINGEVMGGYRDWREMKKIIDNKL